MSYNAPVVPATMSPRIPQTAPLMDPSRTPSAAPPTVPPTVVPLGPTPPLTPWRQNFPTRLSVTLSVLQFIFACLIIGCELGSILIDIVTATIYVGFWAGLFFLLAAIAQSGASCCCRERGCATFTLVAQCIALFFSLCVIGFDAYFISNSSTCFFSSTVCNGTGSTRGVFYSTSNFNDIKMSLIKAQLAFGCVMLVLCIISIALYVVTALRSRQPKIDPVVMPPPLTQSPLPIVPTGPDGMIMAPPTMSIRPPRGGSPLYHRPTIVVDRGDGRSNDLKQK